MLCLALFNLCAKQTKQSWAQWAPGWVLELSVTTRQKAPQPLDWCGKILLSWRAKKQDLSRLSPMRLVWPCQMAVSRVYCTWASGSGRTEGFHRKYSPQLLHSFKRAKISQDSHHCCLSAGQNFFRSSFLTLNSHLVFLKGFHLVSCGRGFHGTWLNKVQIKHGKHIFWGSILDARSSKSRKSHVLPVIFYCMS